MSDYWIIIPNQTGKTTLLSAYWAKLPSRRDRWVYRWRCCTRWTYMRQTWVFAHGRLVEWRWNR